MSQAHVETIEQALTAAQSNPEALFGILHEEVEWDYVGAFPESATYHGPDAVRGFFQNWAGAFDGFGFEAEEIIEAGDSVAVCLRQWGRGKETGAMVENRTWQLFTFDDDKVVRCRGYETKAAAMKAAGV